MISKADAYEFVDYNVAILAESGINPDVSRIKDSIDRGAFTKKDFLSFIHNEIIHFLYQWSEISSTRNTFDIDLLIIGVKKSGKLFKYTYFKDLETFKKSKLVSIEQGFQSLIISFSNGDLYRMCFQFRPSDSDSRNIIISKIDSLPRAFDASELKDIILQILKPILEFKHEDDGMTQFMKNEFLKYIPFENHDWISKEYEPEVSNWEYCISNGSWCLTRDRVKIILNMFLSALEEYSNDLNAPTGWNEVVNHASVLIKSI